MYENNKSPLSQKSDAFSARVIKMVRFLNKEKDKCLSSVYNQVLRSGTSISANIGESQFAQSPRLFDNNTIREHEYRFKRNNSHAYLINKHIKKESKYNH